MNEKYYFSWTSFLFWIALSWEKKRPKNLSGLKSSWNLLTPIWYFVCSKNDISNITSNFPFLIQHIFKRFYYIFRLINIFSYQIHLKISRHYSFHLSLIFPFKLFYEEKVETLKRKTKRLVREIPMKPCKTNMILSMSEIMRSFCRFYFSTIDPFFFSFFILN